MKADNSSKISSFNKSVLPWLICCIGMLFYCYNYFLRVSPNVMQYDLMQNLHITASQLGAFAFFYYIAYTCMQIPVGMIYDRFGTRLVLFLACVIATSGLGVFIHAEDLSMASLGRFLIGFGTAFAYIGVLKIASLWLPPKRFAAVAGLTTAFGMAAAMFSNHHLTSIVQTVGYKSALNSAFFFGIGLSLFILAFMRNKPQLELAQPGTLNTPMTFKQLLNAVRVVFTNPQMWLIGVIGCLFYLPASVFLDMWGNAYLKVTYQLSPETVVSILDKTFIGWIIAGPVIGALSDRIKRRRLPLRIASVVAAILMCIIFYVPNLSIATLNVLFFLVGLSCGAHPLCFALGKDNCPTAISGTAVAVTNTLIMAGGFIFHPIVGKLLDSHASGLMSDGMPVYTSGDYIYALSIIPIGLVISIALTFLLKETYCSSYEARGENHMDTVRTNVVSLQPGVEVAS